MSPFKRFLVSLLFLSILVIGMDVAKETWKLKMEYPNVAAQVENSDTPYIVRHMVHRGRTLISLGTFVVLLGGLYVIWKPRTTAETA